MSFSRATFHAQSVCVPTIRLTCIGATGRVEGQLLRALKDASVKRLPLQRDYIFFEVQSDVDGLDWLQKAS